MYQKSFTHISDPRDEGKRSNNKIVQLYFHKNQVQMVNLTEPSFVFWMIAEVELEKCYSYNLLFILIPKIALL